MKCSPLCGAEAAYGRFVQPRHHDRNCPAVYVAELEARCAVLTAALEEITKLTLGGSGTRMREIAHAALGGTDGG
jgi:hypothetical protein